MKIHKTPIEGCFEIELTPMQDHRGVFARTFCQKELRSAGVEFQIAQSNFSMTREKGSIRGMHYQVEPKAESKIVRVIRGSIFDVCIDLRRNSTTFGKWHGVELNDKNFKMLLLPKGCAHGFQTLEDNCEMIYFHDEFYTPECDRTAHHQDPLFAIRWPLPVASISDKDKSAPFFSNQFKGIEL